MDLDANHKTKKGKRNSGGSSLNTPSLSTSVRRFSRISLFDTDAGNQKRLGHAEPSPSARHREHSHGVARKTSNGSTKTSGRSAPKPKPVYVSASTQTDDDGSAANQSCTPPRPMRPPPISFKRRLLQQAQQEKLQRERLRSASVKEEVRSPALLDVSSSKPSPLPPSPPLEDSSAMDTSTGPVADVKNREPTPTKEPSPSPMMDTKISDADQVVPESAQPKDEEMTDAPASISEPATETSQPSVQPSIPPSVLSPTSTDATVKSADLHVEMPAKPDLAAITGINLTTTPGAISNALNGSAVAQSPASGTIGSPFSPAVTNAVNPTPARKKLSLSDYTSRRAKQAKTHPAGPNSTPSLAQSQSTSSPTLSTASLPNANSPSRKSVEPAQIPAAEGPKPVEPKAEPPTESTSTST